MLMFFNILRHGSSFENYTSGAFVTLQRPVSESQVKDDVNAIMTKLVQDNPSIVDRRICVARESDHPLPNYLQFSPIDYTISADGIIAPMDNSSGPRWKFMPEANEHLAPDTIIPANSLLRILPEFGNGSDIRLVRTHVDMREKDFFLARNQFQVVENIDAFIDTNVAAKNMTRVHWNTIELTFPDYPYSEDNTPIKNAENALFNIIQHHANNGQALNEHSTEIAPIIADMRARGSEEYPARSFAIDDLFIMHAPSNNNGKNYPQLVINWKHRPSNGVIQSITDPSGHDTIGPKHAFIQRAA